MTVSQWADAERFLSSEGAAEPGRWKTSRVPYMREIMDAVADPMIKRVVVAKAAQTAYTEACLNNVCGYYIDQDPTSILVIMPTLELAESWSKDRLMPMLRDTPVLQNLVHIGAGANSKSTLRNKAFPGGRLTMIGANAPSGLASRPIRVVLADEVDRWPLSAGGEEEGEGDPLSLAAKRQTTFWNRKIFVGSTPKHKDTSVIWREWLASDMRRYHCPCAHCGELQFLKWQQVRWDKTDAGEHLPETACYVCEHCGSLWSEAERHIAVARGQWIAGKPTRDVAGFHVPGLISPWLTMFEIVEEFLKVRRDRNQLQTWVNTVLGEPFEDQSEKIEASALIGRGENYGPEAVPDGALIVTAGVDVQLSRIEILYVAFGLHEESWTVAQEVILGDPQGKEIWDDVDGALLRIFKTESGREMRVRAACIDSGGHATAQVLAFARNRYARKIYAIKGKEGTRPIWPRQASKSSKGKIPFYLIGVDTCKDALYGRLSIRRHGPGFCHFPVGAPFDQKFFDQLASEVCKTKMIKGRALRYWFLPSGRRNEALDCFVYAIAARNSLRLKLISRPDFSPKKPAATDAPETSANDLPAVTEREATTPAQVAALPQRPVTPWTRRPGGWIGQRRGSWFNR
jgi:phage terminase large subunit GpA-like protein